MAARRSSGRSADTSDIANAPTDLEAALLSPVLMPAFPVSRVDEFLGEALPYDRRRFSFGEPETYGLVNVTPRGHGPFSREQIGFSDAGTVAICHRRKVRREVLFAKRVRRGYGARRRSWRSLIKC